MGVVDAEPGCPSLFHAGKPTPQAIRSAVSGGFADRATDGHPRGIEGLGKSLLLRSMTARVAGLGFLTESTEDTETWT